MLPLPTHQQRRATSALWLYIPHAGQTISVEHPCVVKNADKAIDMIGGAPAVAQALEEESDKTLALSFRPQDPAARTIPANKRDANNVLLRISVPKRTGRKRKRGSNVPWQEDSATEVAKRDATYLVRSMTDNPDAYSVNALSRISAMHIWRSMPDFVYSTSHINMVQEVKAKLLSQDYGKIKTFSLPRTYGLQDTTSVPPPVWSTQSIPQHYIYRQNPSAKVVSDPTTGKTVITNTQAPPKIYSYQVQWDTTEYPKEPMAELPSIELQSPVFQDTVAALKPLFEERPIWTRRALLNCLESSLSSFNVVRFCLAYVAYAVRSGPWRDTYVRLGVDPRTDPECRFYQAVMLQLVPKQHLKPIPPPKKTAKDQSREVGAIEPPVAGQQAETADQPEANGIPNAPAEANVTISSAEMNMFQSTRTTYQRFWSRSDDRESHIFDGRSPLPPDGKVWQLCDFADSQLASLRDIPELHIRAECETRYFGWYANGTMAKIRVALKAKIDALQEGRVLDPKVLEGFIRLPERVGDVKGFDQAHHPTNTRPPNQPQLEQNTNSLEPAESTGTVPEEAQTAGSALDTSLDTTTIPHPPKPLFITPNLEPYSTGTSPQPPQTIQYSPISTPQSPSTNTRPTSHLYLPPVSNSRTRTDALSIYLGSHATKQQLEWASLYRAFARTEPGQKPVTGGWGTGRLTKSKPETRASYKGSSKKDVTVGKKIGPKLKGTGNGELWEEVLSEEQMRRIVEMGATGAAGEVREDPIDVDAETDGNGDGDVDMDDAASGNNENASGDDVDGPDLEVDEDVLPSIEYAFGEPDVDDSDLGLDVEEPIIKLETDEYGNVVGFEDVPLQGGAGAGKNDERSEAAGGGALLQA